MEINFNDLVDGVSSILSQSINEGLPQIKEYSTQIIEEQKESLQELATLRLNGTISDEEFNSEIEDQKEVVKNQLLAIENMAIASAQSTTNAIIEFLGNSVLAMVKVAL